MKIRTIEDVIESQLCTGCGGCAYIEPLRYRMANDFEVGIRPFLVESPIASNGDALKICPGIKLTHEPIFKDAVNLKSKLLRDWGPIYGVWEGYALDSEIRYSGSSGGATTALALYCLEKENMANVLHTSKDNKAHYLNKTVMSSNREQLIERTGSRYAPASPVEGLSQIELSNDKSVFIGKPCDVAAVAAARKIRPKLDSNIGLTIAFFCAGVPSTNGTLSLLALNSEKLCSLKNLRYRGHGWPGFWSASYINSEGELYSKKKTYAESWGYLQRFRQWRCYICPDHTGEFADISVGDPWHRSISDNDPGRSLIIARTQRGLDVLQNAVKDGYLHLDQENSELLPKSQPNLIKTRGNLWGRLISLKLFGAAVPNYTGFHLYQSWLHELNFKEKFRSIIGTIKRIFTKKLYKRKNISESTVK